MHFLCVLALPLLGLALAQIPPLNTSQEFYVRTQVRPGQTGKEAFENLWLYAYHTGAGTNDAMLSSNKSHAARGSLNASALRPPSGRTLYGLVLDLNTPGIPWSAAPNRGANTYSAWQPVGINAGNGAAANNSAFYLDDNGLQWTDAAGGGSAEGFGGWLGECRPLL